MRRREWLWTQGSDAKIATELLKEIRSRLRFLLDVGLTYDAVGLALEEERLPQRIRRSRRERPMDVGPKSDGD